LPVITQVYCINTDLRRSQTVLYALHPFETNWQIGMFAQPGNVLPIQFGVNETSSGSAYSAAFRIGSNPPTRYTRLLNVASVSLLIRSDRR
jgi:hypothetical protein